MSTDWTWTPVEEILQTITGSLDMYAFIGYEGKHTEALPGESLRQVLTDDGRTVFWQGMMEHKCSDPGFGLLVESIQRDGWLAPIGWDPELCYLSNGHHRMAAAILLGLDAIPTTVTDATCWSADGGVFEWEAEADGFYESGLICEDPPDGGDHAIHLNDYGWTDPSDVP
jgi:hypothetical protein